MHDVSDGGCNKNKFPHLAGIAQFVQSWALGHEVVGSNLTLSAVPEVTLGGHSSGSLTIPSCKIGTRP